MSQKITTSIRLIESTKDEAKILAKAQGINLSALIETLLQRAIKKEKREQARQPVSIQGGPIKFDVHAR